MALVHVKTEYGVLKGAEQPEYTVFKGVPYAKPPVGPLRFKAPQEPDSWDGVRPALEWPADDYQMKDILGPWKTWREPHTYSEDCLYLNIWTPASDPEERLPVMFWIHGGGGNSHENHIDGAAYSTKGVILVSFNFRTGYLSGLALEELADEDPHHSTGALGAQDILAALKWVNRNIAAFGGDPENVTVFGQSGGAMMTKMLLAAPPARGLFRHAIAQSGGGTWDVDPVRPMEEKMVLCRQVLDSVGWTLDDMRTKEPGEIYAVLKDAESKMNIRQQSRARSVFGQSTDHYMIPGYYGISIYNGAAADIDILCGTISEEWHNMPYQVGPIDGYHREFAMAPGIMWARRQNELERKPVYHYFYEHTFPTGEPMNHSHDLPYMFGSFCHFDFAWTDYDRLISGTVVDYWTSFAKTGNPNVNGRPEWNPYTKEHPVSMYIGNTGMECRQIDGYDRIEEVIRFMMRKPGIMDEPFVPGKA